MHHSPRFQPSTRRNRCRCISSRQKPPEYNESEGDEKPYSFTDAAIKLLATPCRYFLRLQLFLIILTWFPLKYVLVIPLNLPIVHLQISPDAIIDAHSETDTFYAEFNKTCGTIHRWTYSPVVSVDKKGQATLSEPAAINIEKFKFMDETYEKLDRSERGQHHLLNIAVAMEEFNTEFAFPMVVGLWNHGDIGLHNTLKTQRP
jgi:hypothetical protein